MRQNVHCRICKKEINRDLEKEGVDWIMRSEGWYYHKSCWETYAKQSIPKTDEEWFDLLFYIITNDLHSSYNYFQIKSQCEKMKAEGKTMKGIYFTTYWYFVLQKKEYKPEYGLGIIPYVYDQSIEYWAEREKKEKGILAEITRLKRIEAGEGRNVAARRTNRKKVTAEPVI